MDVSTKAQKRAIAHFAHRWARCGPRWARIGPRWARIGPRWAR